MNESITHKRGDTFDWTVHLPASFPDGHFLGYAVAAQVRRRTGELVDALVCTWIDAMTTRTLNLFCLATSGWPLEPLLFDVQFTRTADGYTISSESVVLYVVQDQTQVTP